MTDFPASNLVVAFNNFSINNTIYCGLVSPDYLEQKLILISIFGGSIGVFGIFGNICALFIFSRPSMRSPNNLFLSTLATFDTLLLLTAISVYGMEYIIAQIKSYNFYLIWLSYLRFMFALGHISQTGSVYTTVAVTLERFLAIVYPRKSKRLCSKTGALISIMIVCCFAIFFNASRFFEIEVIRNDLCPIDQFQTYVVRPGSLGRNKLYNEVYSLWITNVVMVFFPFLCLFVFNALIAKSIHKSVPHSAFTPNHKAMKDKSKEATVILVVVVTIFLVCNLWGFVLTLLERVVKAETLLAHPKLYTFSREVINFLAMVNASVNFVIYMIFGKEFRKQLLSFNCCSNVKLSILLPNSDKFSPWRSGTRRKAIKQSTESFPTKINKENEGQTYQDLPEKTALIDQILAFPNAETTKDNQQANNGFIKRSSSISKFDIIMQEDNNDCDIEIMV